MKTKEMRNPHVISPILYIIDNKISLVLISKDLIRVPFKKKKKKNLYVFVVPNFGYGGWPKFIDFIGFYSFYS